jgi:hypothetical protein
MAIDAKAIIKGLNILSSLIIIGLGVLEIIGLSLAAIIIGSFVVFIGAMLFINEITQLPFIKTHLPFLLNHLGRGIILIFCGGLLFSKSGALLIGSIIVISTGVLHLFMHFFKVPYP